MKLKLLKKFRLAEIAPNPTFFEIYLDDNALMDGKKMKSFVVKAHRPEVGHKFDDVFMRVWLKKKRVGK